jgi:hypothetical protein
MMSQAATGKPSGLATVMRMAARTNVAGEHDCCSIS